MKVRRETLTGALEKMRQAEVLLRDAAKIAQTDYNVWQVVVHARRRLSYARDFVEGHIGEESAEPILAEENSEPRNKKGQK